MILDPLISIRDSPSDFSFLARSMLFMRPRYDFSHWIPSPLPFGVSCPFPYDLAGAPRPRPFLTHFPSETPLSPFDLPIWTGCWDLAASDHSRPLKTPLMCKATFVLASLQSRCFMFDPVFSLDIVSPLISVRRQRLRGGWRRNVKLGSVEVEEVEDGDVDARHMFFFSFSFFFLFPLSF